MMEPWLGGPELRTIPVSLLRPGMFVHDLKSGWLAHSFWRRRFLIEDEDAIERLRKDESIREVVIDIAKGLDVAPAALAPTPDETRLRFAALDRRYREVMEKRAEQQRNLVSLDEERSRMRFLRRESIVVVRDLMGDVRVGRQVDVQRVEPVIEKMMGSVMRYKDALIPLLRLKDHNQYSFQHSVSVAALSLAFGATLGFDEQTLRQVALGALLHDIGKARTPEHILNKPGRLSDDEMIRMREHVVDSCRILAETPGITQVALESASLHHERFDGSGYPYGLAGDDIPIHAQVVSIADAYDAMTSGRCYQHCIEPTDALRRMFGAANQHFREEMLQAFTRTVGIYPVGSLVRLDNEHLAVVLEVDRDNLLKPLLQVIFDTRNKCYVSPYELNLARRRAGPSIVDYEPYARWGIDPQRLLVH